MTATADSSRSRLPAALVAALVVVVLGAGLATAAVRRSPGAEPPAPRAAPPATDGGTTVVAPTSTTPAPPASPGEPAYITKIRQQVSELRGLAWKAPLKVEVVSRDELARRAKAANDRDRRPDRMAGDEDTYKILHLIPSDMNLTQTIDDLLSGAILGFYDPKTKELVVGQTGTGDSGEVDGATKVTLAHELDHALDDQWFDFGGKTQALDDADRQEEIDGFDALIEGNAKFVEGRFADADLTEEEQADYAFGSLAGGDSGAAIPKELPPPFLEDYLYYPYSAGLDFVKAEAGTGPDVNARVNAAFGRPPTSTEQILHPELYDSGQQPATPDLPDIAAATGCEARRRNVLGEFKMQEVLKADFDIPAAEAGAAGWDGDVFETVRCGSSLGFVDRWQADSDQAAAGLVRALTGWAPKWAGSGSSVSDGHFSGPGGTGRIVRTGSVVTLVLGADAATADRVASVL